MTTRRAVAVAGVSFLAGAAAYWAVDRITFLTGHTIRDIRHATRTTP